MCSSPELSNKKLYSTFIRTYAQTTKLPDYLVLLLDRFKWKNVGILYMVDDSWLDTKDNIKKKLEVNGIKVRAEEQLPDASEWDRDPEGYKPQMKQKLKIMKDEARSKFRS